MYQQLKHAHTKGSLQFEKEQGGGGAWEGLEGGKGRVKMMESYFNFKVFFFFKKEKDCFNPHS